MLALYTEDMPKAGRFHRRLNYLLTLYSYYMAIIAIM